MPPTFTSAKIDKPTKTGLTRVSLTVSAHLGRRVSQNDTIAILLALAASHPTELLTAAQTFDTERGI